MTLLHMTLLTLLGILLQAGCSGASSPQQSEKLVEREIEREKGNSAAQISPTEEGDGRLLTETRKKEFVDRAIAFIEGRSSDVDPIDTAWFIAMIRKHGEIKEGEAEEDIRATEQQFKEDYIIHRCRTEAKAAANTTFLRFSLRDDRPTALFRVIKANGNFYHFEIALVAGTNGKTAASDIFDYRHGEWQSETYFRGFAMSLSNPGAAILRDVLGEGRHTKEELNVVSQFIDTFNSKNWMKTLEQYQSLPERLRYCRSYLHMRHTAAMKLRDLEAVEAGLLDMRKHCDGEALLYSCEIDLASLLGKTSEIVEAIDRLEKAIGGDPYLDVFRSLVMRKAKDLARAKAFAAQAVEREPTLFLAHFQAASLAQSEGDFKAVAMAFRAAEKVTKIDAPFIEASPEFAPFVASPQFQAWKAESEAKK